MTKIPHDEILEGLHKLRTREFEKLKTVLELYDLEIHQKKVGPDYHRLKTMVKRSIEWGPQGMCLTGGGGLARVPWHTQGEKDELTSCRGTV